MDSPIEWETVEEDDNGKQTRVKWPGIPDAFNGRMQALMIECKEGFNKDGNSGKKGMMEWIEGHDDSNENWGIVTIVKNLVKKIGIRFLRLLFDFLFVMWNHEKGAENIDRFRSALIWVSEGANSRVIYAILTMLETMDRELSEMKRCKEERNKALKGKLPAASEETGLDDSNQQQSSFGSSRVFKLGDQFTLDDMYRVFDIFLEASLRLEAVLSHPSLPESSHSLRQALKFMVDGDMMKCEKAVESVGEEMKKLEETHPLKEVLKDAKMRVTRHLVELKINEFWGLVEPQESKGTEVEPDQSEKRKEKPSDGNCCFEKPSDSNCCFEKPSDGNCCFS